jgi:hypothetical protein
VLAGSFVFCSTSQADSEAIRPVADSVPFSYLYGGFAFNFSYRHALVVIKRREIDLFYGLGGLLSGL